jgi:hypothetical protein
VDRGLSVPENQIDPRVWQSDCENVWSASPVWSALGVQFKPDPEFARGLRYSEHPNGNCVAIYYVTDHQWSRYRREKELEDGTTILDHMVQAVKKLFTTGRLLWHANKSMDEIPFAPPAVRLPNKPHGL